MDAPESRKPVWRDRTVQAANAEKFLGCEDTPAGLRSLAHVVQACQQMLDAPEDLPASDKSFMGLVVAFRSLDKYVPGARAIAIRVEASIPEAAANAAEGATILSLRGRRGRHLIYALAIETGNASKKQEPLDDGALVILGAWCLHRLFDASQPTRSAIARVKAALVRPSGTAAGVWSDQARSRAKALALRNLEEAIRINAVVALQYGLSSATPRMVRSMDPISVANRLFRRRTENLIHYAAKDAVSGAGGYGTLSEPGLRNAGLELMARVKTGDKKAALVCLEIITHLPSKTMLKIPIQIGERQPLGALAWLNLEQGWYCQCLYKISESGARPYHGTAHLYEETTQVVTTWLSPPLHKFLQSEFNARGGAARCVEELLGDVGHQPQSAVAGKGAYRHTARRIQESLPMHLLARGHHRWSVALATNSHFLVSIGRPSYGACRTSQINETINSCYRLLGWPTRDCGMTQQLVGSFTTPKPESITAALNFLADEADSIELNASDLKCASTYFNRQAVWMSMFLALSFALRQWLIYALPSGELRLGACVHFDDKYVHEHKGPPVPIAPIVHQAVCGWYCFCETFAKALSESHDPQCLELAEKVSSRIRDEASVEGIFEIDDVGRLEPVGSRTWGNALPENLRLRPNFARQFWPLQLITKSVEQLLIDVLMRHQQEGLHPGSSHAVKKTVDSAVRLKKSMDEILISLGLRFPETLGQSDHG